MTTALLLGRPGPAPTGPAVQLDDVLSNHVLADPVMPDRGRAEAALGLLLRAVGILAFGVALVVAGLSLLLVEAVMLLRLVVTTAPPT